MCGPGRLSAGYAHTAEEKTTTFSRLFLMNLIHFSHFVHVCLNWNAYAFMFLSFIHFCA